MTIGLILLGRTGFTQKPIDREIAGGWHKKAIAGCDVSDGLQFPNGRSTRQKSQDRNPRNFAGLAAYPGKTAFRFDAPRWRLEISPNTSRKSVVNARSRPSYN